MPANGKKSVRAWLDNYYAKALQVETPLAHHVSPRLSQTYVFLEPPVGEDGNALNATEDAGTHERQGGVTCMT